MSDNWLVDVREARAKLAQEIAPRLARQMNEHRAAMQEELRSFSLAARGTLPPSLQEQLDNINAAEIAELLAEELPLDLTVCITVFEEYLADRIVATPGWHDAEPVQVAECWNGRWASSLVAAGMRRIGVSAELVQSMLSELVAGNVELPLVGKVMAPNEAASQVQVFVHADNRERLKHWSGLVQLDEQMRRAKLGSPAPGLDVPEPIPMPK